MVLVIDPQMAGASGDMLLCALVDLGADEDRMLDTARACSESMPGSSIRTISFERNSKGGIHSVGLALEIDEDTTGRSGADIRQAIVWAAAKLGLSEKARQFAKSCIDSLIGAESRVHGVPVESVHFHEAASLDTVIDIVCSAAALEDLDLFEEEIKCMPIAVGGGTVTFSHGTVSNPASAVLEILKGSGLAIFGGPAKDELTTPTGACMLASIGAAPAEYYPQMKIADTGYGAGTKNFDSFPNVLKLVRGDSGHSPNTEHVLILETNVDDVSGEILGGLVDKLLKQGARDVSIYPGTTKKNRPTHLVSVMCDDDSAKSMTDTIFEETGTLGIRMTRHERVVLQRTIHHANVLLDGREFGVRYKASSFGRRTRVKAEFDDLQEISNVLCRPVWEIRDMVERQLDAGGDTDA